jgi:hypothetical protein
MIQGPAKKYPPITGAQFISDAMARNRLQSAEVARKAAMLDPAIVAKEVHYIPQHLRQEQVA